jgi:hypothetical protein
MRSQADGDRRSATNKVRRHESQSGRQRARGNPERASVSSDRRALVVTQDYWMAATTSNPSWILGGPSRDNRSPCPALTYGLVSKILSHHRTGDVKNQQAVAKSLGTRGKVLCSGRKCVYHTKCEGFENNS